jgi:tRNA-splicing endonuclease subunit Sen34
LPHEKKRQKTKSERENEETPWTAVLRTPNNRVDTPYVNERDGVVDGGNQTSLWSFPRTDSQRRRCAVFAHMHARGVTLTSGAKFGAEYLAYPGDPAAYHAAFTVRVMDGDDDDDLQKQTKRESESDDEEEERDDARFVSLLSLVAATRMSHGARKHCVLAGARRVEGEEKIKAEEESGGLLSEARRAATRALGEWEVSCVTVVPDVEQSSQRRGRVGA